MLFLQQQSTNRPLIFSGLLCQLGFNLSSTVLISMELTLIGGCNQRNHQTNYSYPIGKLVFNRFAGLFQPFLQVHGFSFPPHGRNRSTHQACSRFPRRQSVNGMAMVWPLMAIQAVHYRNTSQSLQASSTYFIPSSSHVIQIHLHGPIDKISTHTCICVYKWGSWSA